MEDEETDLQLAQPTLSKARRRILAAFLLSACATYAAAVAYAVVN